MSHDFYKFRALSYLLYAACILGIVAMLEMYQNIKGHYLYCQYADLQLGIEIPTTVARDT